jgi:hypothetical protein
MHIEEDPQLKIMHEGIWKNLSCQKFPVDVWQQQNQLWTLLQTLCQNSSSISSGGSSLTQKY